MVTMNGIAGSGNQIAIMSATEFASDEAYNINLKRFKHECQERVSSMMAI